MIKPLIIGVDGSRAFSKDKTGTENYSYQILKNLSLIDTENKYYVYIRPGAVFDLKDWPDNFKFKLLNFHRLWTQVGLSIQTFKDQLDLLFVPSHTLPLIRKPGLKTVITVHDLGSEYLPFSHQLKQLLYLKFMTYIQLKTASKIIAVSEATKKDLINKVNLSSSKIKVIYEGISELFKRQLKDSDPNTKDDILRYYEIEKYKYFLFVGTIQPRKNLERLIEAYSIFLIEYRKENPAHLVIAGGKGWKDSLILSLPEKLGIKEKVHFIGRVKDSDLATIYKGALAFTYPSLFEGFGLPILEAFAAGIPIITSSTSSMPEIAGKAALIVNPYKVKDIAEALLKVMQDDGLRKGLISLGRERLNHFSWKKAAQETLELFRSL